MSAKEVTRSKVRYRFRIATREKGLQMSTILSRGGPCARHSCANAEGKGDPRFVKT
jgi:hypothetical protein